MPMLTDVLLVPLTAWVVDVPLAFTVPLSVAELDVALVAAPVATVGDLRLRLLTCTGVLLFAVVPFPNCPYGLYPHALTVPSDFRAKL